MPTEYLSVNPQAPNADQVRHVAQALAEGALVALPTDTVYGVAVNAARGESVRRLRDLKGESAGQSFTVHIARREDCERFVPRVPPVGQRLVKKGWPGPLTLVFDVEDPSAAPVYSHLSPEGVAAIYVDGAVGLRVPDHPVASAILSAASAPIVASSANLSGSAPSVSGEEVREHLGNRIDLVVDSGPTRYRKGSTIVRLNGQGYRVIRAGVFDERTVRRLASLNILFVCSGNTCRSPMAEGIFKKMIAQRLGSPIESLPDQGIVIRSAGTYGGSGAGAAPNALEVCRRREVDIRSHRSRALSAELIQAADYIFTMSQHHYEAVVAIAPDAAGRTVLLDPESEIADPIGASLEEYEDVAQRITQALEKRIEEVSL